MRKSDPVLSKFDPPQAELTSDGRLHLSGRLDDFPADAPLRLHVHVFQHGQIVGTVDEIVTPPRFDVLTGPLAADFDATASSVTATGTLTAFEWQEELGLQKARA